MALRWDSYRGCFVKEAEYEKTLQEERERLAAELKEWEGEDPEEVIKRKAIERGLKITGGITLRGEVANNVREWLNERGYKDLDWEANLVRLLPEDKSYRDFVKEAIYWYARQVGMPLNFRIDYEPRTGHKAE